MDQNGKVTFLQQISISIETCCIDSILETGITYFKYRSSKIQRNGLNYKDNKGAERRY